MPKILSIASFAFKTICRSVNELGQTYFSMWKFLNFTHTPYPVAMPMVITALAGCVGRLSITTIPAMWDNSTENNNNQNTQIAENQDINFNLPQKIMSGSLKTAVACSGIMSSCVAYFATTQLWAATTERDQTWKDYAIPISSAVVAAGFLASYIKYEYFILKPSAERMAKATACSAIKCDKNIAKATAIIVPNIAIYLALSYFWATPAINSIPYAQKLLGDIGTKIIIGLSGTATALTVVATSPYVYDLVSLRKIASVDPAQENEKPHRLKPIVRFTAYTFGSINILSTGVCAFEASVTCLSAVCNLDPYRWEMILPSAFAGVAMATLHGASNVRPGYLNTLARLKSSPKQDVEVPLLKGNDSDDESENSKRLSVYRGSSYLFATRATGSQASTDLSDATVAIPAPAPAPAQI